jgi:hypothetical protein
MFELQRSCALAGSCLWSHKRCASGCLTCADVNLWEEQLPAGTLVVLSGRDALMAAPQVGGILAQCTTLSTWCFKCCHVASRVQSARLSI